ncbi:cytochrome C biosynthesis protein [Aurantiacibacter aquimixticola]|uniref:cytochrome C biosynthesis protein n=1 Tax=Aurantiacibacter aquimixticola TaxID=1958945 RepID=UPI0010591D04|nr:cytochrome C biosynthesis protein [Aurantiacibacter aquimixticola]
MTWVAAIALALAAFALAAWRLDKRMWTSMAMVLALGLAGYAWQASPNIPAAPKSAQRDVSAGDLDVAAQRREFIGEPLQSRADLMFPADAMARRGRSAEAAALLTGITKQNPWDFEAWVALGNALVDHADGAITPPALYAYRQAAAIAPGNPAPAYFIGASMIRQGRFREAQAVWAEALRNAPEDAVGRDGLEFRLRRLDALLDAASQAPAEAASQ